MIKMGRVAIERYRKFIESLPVWERDKPIIMKFGRNWSPLEVLAEMERNTDIGQQFQAAEEKLMGAG